VIEDLRHPSDRAARLERQRREHVSRAMELQRTAGCAASRRSTPVGGARASTSLVLYELTCLNDPDFVIRATAGLQYVSLGRSGRQRRGTRRR
jgi:hypothetical protein